MLPDAAHAAGCLRLLDLLCLEPSEHDLESNLTDDTMTWLFNYYHTDKRAHFVQPALIVDFCRNTADEHTAETLYDISWDVAESLRETLEEIGGMGPNPRRLDNPFDEMPSDATSADTFVRAGSLHWVHLEMSVKDS